MHHDFHSLEAEDLHTVNNAVFNNAVFANLFTLCQIQHVLIHESSLSVFFMVTRGSRLPDNGGTAKVTTVVVVTLKS